MSAYPQGNSSVIGETPVLPRRRKIRKGIKSCWECKRRKIRCTFRAPTEAICDGCRSRRTNCTKQEFQDDTALANRNVDRISRIESLVGQLVKRNNIDMPDTLPQDQTDPIKYAEQQSQSLIDDQCGDFEPALSVPAAVSSPDLESQMTCSYDELCRTLLALWPDERDLNLILSVPLNVSVMFHGVIFMPYDRFVSTQIASPRHILQLPPLVSHPVLIARKLLMLGTYLQGIPPTCVSNLAGMSSDYRTIMLRVVNTVTRLVTSNDEIVSSSLEGIECMMIESMYFNNAGNLRRAWLTNRKAMVMAQMMGIHTGNVVPSFVLENATRDRIDPNYMWFRQVLSDRYLSLMLGLPQCSNESVFASPKALESCTAIERMERMEAVAAGLIIQRNSAEQTEPAVTNKIDKMLRDAAALMSPQWWMTPALTTVNSNDAKAFEESIRSMNHFAHHHLLVQLHLPSMLQTSSTGQNYDYSKMTAASASRAIVTQFVSLHNHSIPASAYCRGIDFVAFIASATLCLAHIEARCQHKTKDGSDFTVLQSFQHQRLGDRGILECTLEIIETMASRYHDINAQKISSILKPLLTIEKSSAKGASYDTSANIEVDHQLLQGMSLGSESFNILCIRIPYFGTIKIEKPFLLPDTNDLAQAFIFDELGNSAEAGFKISKGKAHNTEQQPIISSFSTPDPFQLSRSTYWDPSFSFEFSGVDYLHPPVVNLAVDDWASQGVLGMASCSSVTNDRADSLEMLSRDSTE